MKKITAIAIFMFITGVLSAYDFAYDTIFFHTGMTSFLLIENDEHLEQEMADRHETEWSWIDFDENGNSFLIEEA
jgi:hypothetical protein